MNTIAEWLGTLPEPHRSRALANCRSPHYERDSLRHAIMGHAIWVDTPQGYAYWARVWRGDYTAEPATPPDAVRDCVGCAHLDAPVCSEPCATCAMYASRPHWKARAQAEGGGE